MNYGGIAFVVCFFLFPAIAVLIKRAICGPEYHPINSTVADATHEGNSYDSF